MTDEQNPALEAGDEDVTEAVQDNTEQDTDETSETDEGQEKDQPAEDKAKDAEAEEKISRSKARRERRKAELEQQREAAEAAERELTEAKRKLSRFEEALQHAQPPKEADFASYEEYQAKLSAYHSLRAFDERAMKDTKSEAEERQRTYEQLQQRRQAEARSMFEESCSEARERYADFDAVARNPSVAVSKDMADIIVGLDAGPDVLYHLGKNPAQAAQIANMPTVQAALAIGRIEAGLAMPKPITKSNAPDPITPIRGSGSPSKDPAKMSPAEYRKWRENGGSF
ncbi:hypothetical protein [Sulfitobacter sp. 20_GPM-1509m]|uniref:hypothetical protein n=1 Tax=Sulfitobacter sp. 20_GPM-1509m TaxID=1380367 RepID=UPI00048CDA84|nr:hypothetical protein [Sulfitobacter sp. 20_GPM-1509m]